MAITPMWKMGHPPLGYHLSTPPVDPLGMDYSPSSLISVASSEEENYEDNIADELGDKDDVIVIHEHHHHHHHNTEEDEHSQDGAAADSLPTTDTLMENIVNDKVLYDFVSFLLEESQRIKEPEQRKLSSEPMRISGERFTDSLPLYREETVKIVSAGLGDIEHFLEEGFEPIIEVELK